MRRRIIFILFIIFPLTLIGSSQAAIEGIFLKNSPNLALYSKELSSSSLLGNLVILPNEPFDEQEVAKIIFRIDQIPSSILLKMNEKNIKIKLFNGRLTDNTTAHHLKGKIPRGYTNGLTWDDVPGIGGSSIVLVKIGSSNKGNGHGSINLELHELAHSLDRLVYFEISHNLLFQSIWKEERALLFPGQEYFLTYPEEYFAEAFAMYFLGNEPRILLRQKAPKTYELIKELK